MTDGRRSSRSLLSSLAHEVRNPLSVIKASSSFCLDELKPRGRIKENIKVIHRNAEHARKLIDNFLGFARSSNLRVRRVRLAGLLDNVCGLAPLDGDPPVRLVKRYGPGIPEVDADPFWLEQAVFNLVANSIEAMPEGGTLTVAAESSPQGARIAVSDTGVGIASKDLGRVFTPFFTAKAKGMGLGLTVARRVVRAHKGTLRITSGKNRGTKAEIILPAAKRHRRKGTGS